MLIGIDASRAAVARRTGTEMYSMHLLRALLQLPAAHSYRLYSSLPLSGGLLWPKGQGQPANVEQRTIPFRRLWTHIRLSAEIVTRPPDILFVPAHVLPLYHGKHSVVTLHDLGYLHYPEAHSRGDRWYLDWSTRWSAGRASAVIADSAATRADLIAAYGIQTGKIHVVHLGHDGSFVPVADRERLAEVRRRYGLPKRYLLYVGTLQPRKNLARVVAAFARIRDRSELHGVQLVLAGKKGWLYDDLCAQVNRLGLTGEVTFPGYIPDADMPALLSAATAFIFPSLYEGFGIPVLEAGGCGLPVITSNTSSLP
jgi:glycosyltransferase involved in cell wall biosynthesis